MTIDVLEVIHPEAENPVVFSWPLTKDTTLEEGVYKFFSEVYMLSVNPKDADECINTVKRGVAYWFDETWCFTIVPVTIN